MTLAAGLFLCPAHFTPISDTGILLIILIRIMCQSINYLFLMCTTFKRGKFSCSLSIKFCAGTANALKLAIELNSYIGGHSFTGPFFLLTDQLRPSLEAFAGLSFQNWAEARIMSSMEFSTA